MPSLQGTTPDGLHPRDLTIEQDPNNASGLIVWVHPPNSGTGSGWSMRVPKAQFKNFIQSIPESLLAP